MSDAIAEKIIRRFARQALVFANWYVKRLERTGGDGEAVAEIKELIDKLENEVHRIEELGK